MTLHRMYICTNKVKLIVLQTVSLFVADFYFTITEPYISTSISCFFLQRTNFSLQETFILLLHIYLGYTCNCTVTIY